ncbi:MAG: sugar ABC transporter ATP-binding protein [candidate division KSB1 bacterium]|nr:sugar ABC transporter ATP-binding protein [candidate division KSB1 bacterium]MDZ7295003.1 sugar ABC transporter ATP-binding protein [candidate division KSB1 bacterium]MDZ7393934.1 sugar ABC transporter ATP-binding protein [candidate division KSB1 bacterium]
MPLLAAVNISKSFPGVRALKDVSLAVNAGEVHAVVGENGAGKSTLMKILSGALMPDSGTILLDGKAVFFHNPRQAQEAGIGIIYQELTLVPELSVAENIFLGQEPVYRLGLIDQRRMEERAAHILAELRIAISPGQVVRQLRIGQQQLVEIARAVTRAARVLIMDEPTSALSQAETGALFEVLVGLKQRGIAIVYISHRLAEVFQIADRISVLRDGQLVGSVPTAETSRSEVIKMMVGRELAAVQANRPQRRQKTVLQVRGLSLAAETPGSSPLLSGIDLEVREGEILGVTGLLGSGKTELLECLFGLHPLRTSGKVLLHGKPVVFHSPRQALRHGVALLPEDRRRSGLVLPMSTCHNLTLATVDKLLRAFLISRRQERHLGQSLVQRLGIKASGLHQPVETLSGGNQQKVVAGKCLATSPRVLLLDEPTRGIDVGAKAELYELFAALAAQGMAMIVASSELPELLSLADRIMVLRQGSVSAVFERREATQERILEAASPHALPQEVTA